MRFCYVWRVGKVYALWVGFRWVFHPMTPIFLQSPSPKRKRESRWDLGLASLRAGGLGLEV